MDLAIKSIFLLEYTGLLKLVCSHRAEQNLCESDNVFRRKDHFLETNKIRTVKGVTLLMVTRGFRFMVTKDFRIVVTADLY